MKTLLVALLLVLAGLALASFLDGRAGEAPPGGAAEDTSAPGGAAGTPAAAFDERFKKKEGVDAPFDEPVPRALHRIISDLVLGRPGAGERARLEERLVTAMEEAGLGTAVLRDEAARRVIDDILQSVGRFRPEGAVASALTPRQEEMIRSAALGYASRLDRQVPGLLLAGEHSGSLLSAIPAFDLPEGCERLSWGLLSGFDYEEDVPIPPEIQALDGKRAGLAGYMITLSDVDRAREFLLVESVWTCCFGVPPEVHQVVVVRMEGEGVEFTTEPILVLGRLDVGPEREDGFVTSIYRLHATSVRELR